MGTTRAIDFACRLEAAGNSDVKIAAGLTPVGRLVLLHVAAGLHEPDHIAESAGINPGTATALCRRMASDGFLAKKGKKGDPEAYELGAKGKKFLQRWLAIAEGLRMLNYQEK